MGTERDFVATCFEALLGREVEADQVATDLARCEAVTVLQHLVNSPEFNQAVLAPLLAARLPPWGRFTTPFSRRHRLWAADRLPVSEPARATVLLSVDWWDFLTTLLADPGFMHACGREPIVVPPLPSWLVEERFERLAALRQG